MSTAVEFPSEITEEILYHLPVKSLGRFKLVSKPWRSLISEPQFVATHFNRNSSRYCKNSIGLSRDRILYSFEVQESSVNARKLSFHPSWNFSCHRPCLCNGLVLAYRINNDCPILINPTTTEYSILHPPPAANLPADESYFRRSGFEAHGLGYDSRNDDYKFVKIIGLPPVEGICYRNLTIYSLRTNCSRETIVPYKIGFFPLQSTGVYVNGRLHWLCHSEDRSCFIAAFNLEREEFEEVQLPRSLSFDAAFKILQVANGDLICISYNHGSNDNPIDIWVLKDQYGALDYSWKKIPICRLIMGSCFACPLLCFMSGGQEVVIRVDSHKMVAYKGEEKTSRDLKIRGVPGTEFEFCGTYVESLVSPKCVIGLRKDHGGGGGSGSEVTTTCKPVDKPRKAGMHKKKKGNKIVASQVI